MAKKSIIHQRVENDLLQALEECLEITGATKAQFVEMSARAFIQHVREHGRIPMPFAITEKPKNPAHKQPSADASSPHRLNEDAPRLSTPSVSTPHQTTPGLEKEIADASHTLHPKSQPAHPRKRAT